MNELTQILKDMMKEISENPASPKIVEYTKRIDEIRKERGNKMDERLLHYLEKHKKP